MDPDGFTGAILAAEGITDASVLLNGPLGCKYYHGHLAYRRYSRGEAPGRIGQHHELGYFGQSRVPCTFLDENDYIVGSMEKLETVLPIVASSGNGPIIVINSAGASLIGDDIEAAARRLGLADRVTAIDSPPFSEPPSRGYHEVISRIVRDQVGSVRDSAAGRAPVVNLLGLSLMHRHWQGTVAEMGRILGLMGLEVGAVPGAGSGMDALRSSGQADLNIVLCPEYGRRIADIYEHEHGVPYLVPSGGAPLGFDATETFIREVSSVVGVDPVPAIDDLGRARRAAHDALLSLSVKTEELRGASFAVRAESSMAYPLTAWLHSYLGMWPEAVEACPGPDVDMHDNTKRFLDQIGAGSSWMRPIEEADADVVLAEDVLVGHWISEGRCLSGVGISIPERDAAWFIPRTYWGTTGSLLLLEDLINGFIGREG